MRSPDDPRPDQRRRGRAGWRRSLGLPLLGVVVGIAVGALGLSACGKSEPPTILNTEKVERAIEKSSFDQRGKRADVSCPSGVHQKNGLVFACTAVVGDATTRFVVTQKNGAGNVHYVAR